MKYECGITEQDRDNGWDCPMDNPNETEIDGCAECAFAVEVEKE